MLPICLPYAYPEAVSLVLAYSMKKDTIISASFARPAASGSDAIATEATSRQTAASMANLIGLKCNIEAPPSTGSFLRNPLARQPLRLNDLNGRHLGGNMVPEHCHLLANLGV